MMQVTVQRLADEAGVSKMTASRALRGVGRVSPATRARIRQIARDLGHPEADRILTRAPLHRGHTEHRLGLLLPVFHPADIGTDLGQEVVAGMREALTKLGGVLEIKPCASLEDVLHAWENSVAQALVLRRQLPSAWIARLRQIGPVIYAAAFDCQRGVDCVYASEYRAAGMILDLLSGHGHSDIVWFGLHDLNTERELPRTLFDETTVMDRISSSVHGTRHAAWANLAFHQRAEGRQLFLILERDWQQESIEAAMARGLDRMLARRRRSTAVVVASDSMALALLATLRRRGMRVPQDLSVVSYGRSAEGQAGSPRLTTVQLPMRAIGRTIPELIERRLANPEALPVSMQFEATMIVGETTGPCPRAKPNKGRGDQT